MGLHKLTIAKIKSLPPGKYSDGGGLYLWKRQDGGGQWYLRVRVHSRRREMGLGGIRDVSLKEARELAAEWRAVAKKGNDPIKERQRQRRETEKNLHCLGDVVRETLEAKKAELKGDGDAGKWLSPLNNHVLPMLGGVPIAEIDQMDIRNTLRPIWNTKPDAARKAMNRLNLCFRHAAALGLEVDLQAVAKAKELLGKQMHTVTHIPAIPWKEVPHFYASLSEPNLTHLALRILILTAKRSRPIRYMRYDQIDGDVWTIPAEMMKGRLGQTTDFRVPLSDEALKVVDLAKPFDRDGFVFPSVRKGVISDQTMSQHMKRRQMIARPHGFRSSFRDWAAEAADARYEVAETCLGHTIGGEVERSYLKTDYLDQRRVLMQQWADFVSSGASVAKPK